MRRKRLWGHQRRPNWDLSNLFNSFDMYFLPEFGPAVFDSFSRLSFESLPDCLIHCPWSWWCSRWSWSDPSTPTSRSAPPDSTVASESPDNSLSFWITLFHCLTLFFLLLWLLAAACWLVCNQRNFPDLELTWILLPLLIFRLCNCWGFRKFPTRKFSIRKFLTRKFFILLWKSSYLRRYS